MTSRSLGFAELARGRRQAQESSESEYGTFSGLIGGERRHRSCVNAISQDVYRVVGGMMVNAVVHVRHLQSTLAGMFLRISTSSERPRATDSDPSGLSGIFMFPAVSPIRRLPRRV